MTALERMLALESFRESLTLAAGWAESSRSHVLDGLRHEAEPPDGIDQGEWTRGIGAIRLAYEVGAREGFDQVRAEVEQQLRETASGGGLSSLLTLLERDDLVSERIDGTRQRDSYLPIIVNARLALDLRLLDSDPEPSSPIGVTPVVTARFEFDEVLNGHDSIVFQIPATVLDDLSEGLAKMRERVIRVQRTDLAIRVPTWAQLSGGDEGDLSES